MNSHFFIQIICVGAALTTSLISVNAQADLRVLTESAGLLKSTRGESVTRILRVENLNGAKVEKEPTQIGYAYTVTTVGQKPTIIRYETITEQKPAGETHLPDVAVDSYKGSPLEGKYVLVERVSPPVIEVAEKISSSK